MLHMYYINSTETRKLLLYSELADALELVLRSKKSARAHAPLRTSVDLPGGGVLLLMPAYDEQYAITKLVTVHGANAGTGLPVVQADVLVMDARTGERIALLDGTVVTARRTAALSLLAARKLAPDHSGPLLIVGAGTQARSHLEAFVETLGVRRVYVASRDASHAESLTEYARELGADATAVASAGDAMSEATIIVTATTSISPVLSDSVREDTFIAAVGAYTPAMAELPPALVTRSRLYADTIEGAQAEAGDYIQAGVDWSQVTGLADALDLPRPTSGPVIFKSVGHALWDLAAARLAMEGGTRRR
jgi:1-piperideine-2-carboxylate/1-pyrroline-2-carboxylate reductase [NAD(P)H]